MTDTKKTPKPKPKQKPTVNPQPTKKGITKYGEITVETY